MFTSESLPEPVAERFDDQDKVQAAPGAQELYPKERLVWDQTL